MQTILVISALVIAAAPGTLWPGRQASPPATVPKDVAAIFQQRCRECHGGPRPAKRLNLEPEKILASTLDKPTADDPTQKLIDTAAPEKSYLLAKIQGAETIRGGRMPARRPRLPDAELKLLQDWIRSLKGTSRII